MEDYYVYLLERPNGQVFYVGKGQDDYWNRHEQKAKRGEKCQLTTIIQDIWSQGQQVQKRKVYEHLSAEDAYAYQVRMYGKYSELNPEMIYGGSYPRPGRTR